MAAGGLARSRSTATKCLRMQWEEGERVPVRTKHTHTLVRERERGMRNEGGGWKRRRAERKEQDGEGTYDAVAHGKRERETRESERD